MAATDPNDVKAAARQLLRKRAMMAAYTLLGAGACLPAGDSPANAANKPAPSGDSWTVDTSVLHYAEGERITVIEPQIGVRREFSDDRSLSILATVDSITGSTPLGTLPATANTAPNTVTSASGRGTNPIIGKIPLSKMTDTRYALDASWRQPVGAAYTGDIGAVASKETDYLSLGAHFKLARDFDEKNTTVSLGVAPEFDISNPNGGLPVAYADPLTPGSIEGTRDRKYLLSGLAGITQVINRRTLMQFNYGLTYERGYLNDPYKQLSVVNAGGDPVSTVYEKRPGSRIEHSFYWLTQYNIWDQDVFSMSLRYYTDDWGIRSQTLDFAFRRQSTERFYWEPRIRYYQQTAADFFRVGLLSGQALPDHASSDLRLAAVHGVTFGLRFGYTLKNGSMLVLRGEYYIQTGESSPREAVGAQKAYYLFPSVYASILQVQYHFQPGQLFSRKKSS